ncbi:MAG: hypothetical protein KIT58_23145 [Planctomycetota bacterium]|nr:hypothetical protein [Planctomycetota bacterium]
MSISDAKLRRLLEVTWDVAIETSFKERMRLFASGLREVVAFDAFSAAVFDPSRLLPPGAPSGAPLRPLESAFAAFPERHAYFEGYDAELVSQYLTRYLPHDPLTPAAMATPNQPLLLSAFVADDEWDANPFTGEYMRLQGQRYGLCAALTIGEGLLCLGGPTRSAARGDFTPEEVRLFGLLLPILARTALAALLSERLAVVADEAEPSAGPRTGFALFGHDGEAVRLDPGARSFLARLRRTPHAIDKIVAEVLTLSKGGRSEDFVERTFLLDDGTPLRVALTRVGHDQTAVAAIFQELSLGDDQVFGATAARIGLSPREAEICRLVLDGMGNKGIAFKLHVTIETVKSHLKNIFRKAGVSSRVELTALLLGKSTP